MNISKEVKIRAVEKKIKDMKPGDIFIDDLMPEDVIILIQGQYDYGVYRGVSLNYKGYVYDYFSDDVVLYLPGTLSVA